MYSSGAPRAPRPRWNEHRPTGRFAAGRRGLGRLITTGVTVAVTTVAATAGVVSALGAQPARGAEPTGLALTAIAAGGPPAGTVLRAGRFIVDLEGRVLFLHGPSVPPGAVVDTATAGQWAAEGFNAVSIGVRMDTDGTFAGSSSSSSSSSHAGMPARAAADGSDPGLEQLATAVDAVVGRGLRVMIQIVPTAAAVRAGDEAFAAGLRRVAGRFHDVAGLVGFELVAPAGSPALNGAVRDTDAHHLLWRQSIAPFDAAASVVTNDEAALLVGWAAGDPATVLRLVSAADATQLGWFFDRPLNDTTLGAVARPYPAAVAGVPVGFTYSPSGRLLTLSYVPVPAGGGAFSGGAATQIRVPTRVYPDGYVVRANGATVVSAPGAGVLCLVTDARAARVDVRVEPAAAGREPPVAAPVAGDPCPGVTARPTAPPAGGQAVDGAMRTDRAASRATGQAGGTGGGQTGGMALWALPLAGAVGMASVLGGLRWRMRRGRGRGGRAAVAGSRRFP
ncbi:hypothetical protein [Frankia sp. Cj3]|uniref:hypothetical protein n=1 Tax=Frankia sp. Cj3 TaxID=2880976 RepID=UPI001EF473B8|nr:hypothetical protein [Frankia sp. Cj3]